MKHDGSRHGQWEVNYRDCFLAIHRSLWYSIVLPPGKVVNGEGRMRKVKKIVTWVVYKMNLSGAQGANVVCEQGEWDEMERARPGHHMLIREGITNEPEAEQVARESAGGTAAKVATRLKAR